MKPDLDRIRALLRALRDKTVENGCTEQEAMLAAEKMAELLSRHGLTEADIASADYEECEVPVGRRSPLATVWDAIARFADCKGFFVQRASGMHYCYFGTAGDVLVAEYVHGVIGDACAPALADFRLTPTYTRRRTRKTKAAAVRAFQEALAVSVRQKLQAGLWRRYRAGADSSESADQAIALCRRMLDAKAADAGHRFTKMKALQKAEGKFKEDAHLSGFRAGAAIDVHAGVANGAKVTGVLT